MAPVEWPALRGWLGQQQRALGPLWSARQREGRVRECHGDLHLSNVLQWEGQASAFEGIEFDAEMRWIEVLDDVAFLAMNLLANQRRDLAFRFINALAGQPGVPAAAACGAAQYLGLTMQLSRSADARLAITHGLPG